MNFRVRAGRRQRNTAQGNKEAGDSGIHFVLLLIQKLLTTFFRNDVEKRGADNNNNNKRYSKVEGLVSYSKFDNNNNIIIFYFHGNLKEMSEKSGNPFDMDSQSFDSDQYLQKLLQVKLQIGETYFKFNSFYKFVILFCFKAMQPETNNGYRSSNR